MSVIPRFVRDRDTGALCIQILMGSDAATLPLPATMENATPGEIQEYMALVVPDMINGLLEHRAKARKKLAKEANAERS